MSFFRFLKNHSSQPLKTLSLCALALLLAGCGKDAKRPVILLDLGTPEVLGRTPDPVEPETIEEEKILKSIPQETLNKEMSRDAFLKMIKEAKTSKEKAEAPKKVETPKKTEAPKKIEAPKKTEAPKKIEPPKKVEEAPPVETPEEEVPTETTDTGVDSEDETSAETYSGPTSVVDRPRSTREFQLSETAARLGLMDPAEYRQLQKETMGTSFRACNFFLITALVKAEITDENHLPIYQAALFDTKYLEPKGWSKISISTLKKWFKEGRSFDVVLQRNAPKGKAHGHVAIPIGLNEMGQIMVAEGIYAKTSNRIRVYSDETLSTKFKVYVRF